MPEILLHVLTATLYLALGAHFWHSRWRGPALDQPKRGLQVWERMALALALVLHGSTLQHSIFAGDTMRFGFAIALSVMFWLALLLYWIESFYARMEGLQILGLPLAAAASLLPALIPEQHVLVNAHSPAFRFHFLTSMLAYSLFTLAALHALLMTVVERNLHQGRLSPLLAGLPPLLTMEALLFRLIHVAFILLTLALASGVLFSEALFGKAMALNHKTIFAIISWLIFAALLVGRHLRGWRGRLALRWTLAGFAALLLTYVGTRFVLEILLGRMA